MVLFIKPCLAEKGEPQQKLQPKTIKFNPVSGKLYSFLKRFFGNKNILEASKVVMNNTNNITALAFIFQNQVVCIPRNAHHTHCHTHCHAHCHTPLDTIAKGCSSMSFKFSLHNVCLNFQTESWLETLLF